jgi:uncharacterized protein YaaW (UPF0174 family)
MKTDNTSGPSNFANMEPEELLERCATFKHYQALGECLGYNPPITVSGHTRPLKDWKYDELDPECQKDLERWAKFKPAAVAHETICQLLNAATPLWGSPRKYEELLTEVANHLKITGPTGRNLNEFEQTIMKSLLKKALKDIENLSKDKRAKFESELSEFLKKKGVELGAQSPIDYLKTAGAAGLGTLAGTQIVTAIILTHLGIYHAVLFAAGLWAAPTMLIGGAVFAPLMAGSLVYLLGQHNFKKTIPCVAIISTLRQEAMLGKALP